MTLKLLNMSKFLLSLFLICNIAKAQNVSESINVGETNISSNFSVQGLNPVIISLKAKAKLPVALIENYPNLATTNSISLQGSLDASSHTKGGIIVIESDHIKVEAQAKILAKEELGGGAVLIGGDWQGGASKEHRVFKNPKAVYQVTTVNRAQGASTIQVTPETALITGYIL